MNTTTRGERRPAPHHLAPGRPARPRGLPVRRLARGRRPVLVAGAAARARPTAIARRTSPARRSRPGPGCWPSPRAPVSAARDLDFRERQRFWIGDWERFAGRGAVADQVRFEREWGALRAYGIERGVRLFGDVAIYVSPGSADHAPTRSCFRTATSPARRPTPTPPTASCGATRCTTGRRCGAAATAGGWSACAARWSCSTSPGSTTSAASSPTGRCRPARARRSPGRWRRGPGRALFDALERARWAATCRWSPRISG